MINIAKLLKDAPKGTKLYSPLFGEVEFAEVMDTDYVPIRVIKRGYGLRFDECGRYMGNEYPDSECLLFPSKDCRTWEGWKLPLEPKFKVGDWITDGNITIQIEDVRNNSYMYSDGVLFSTGTADKVYHLWTLADIKYGDVLANTAGCILIVKDNESCLCYIDKNGKFHANNNKWFFANFSDNVLTPATKEQRELLLYKMKESGYELNEKKQLHKIIEPKFKVGDTIKWINHDYDAQTITDIRDGSYITVDKYGVRCALKFVNQDEWELAPKPHYDIKNFHVGMPVLVRADNNCRWDYSVFSRITSNVDWNFAVCNGVSFTQCIPFNEDTKHLLGTTDMCDEMYINW